MLSVSNEAAYERVTYPLYGLPLSWEGARWIGGWGGDFFSLAHGGPESPVLRVGSFDVSGWHIEDIEIGIATEVDLFLDRPEASPEDWLRVMMERVSALSWEEVALPVNGEDERFKMLRNGPAWEARCISEEIRIVLDGRFGGFPIEEVELVTIVDARPYLEGHARRHRPAGEDA
jgi:hypothetical protein